MMNFLLTTIIPDLAYIIITTLGAYAFNYYIKFKQDHQKAIDEQNETFKKKVGIEQYNMDKSIAESIVLRIEEEAKNFDWDSEIKHSKATQKIAESTGLDSETIYNIIKATVTKIKMGNIKDPTKPILQTVVNNVPDATPVDPTVKQDTINNQTVSTPQTQTEVVNNTVNVLNAASTLNNTNATNIPVQNQTQTQV